MTKEQVDVNKKIIEQAEYLIGAIEYSKKELETWESFDTSLLIDYMHPKLSFMTYEDSSKNKHGKQIELTLRTDETNFAGIKDQMIISIVGRIKKLEKELENISLP